MQERDTTRNLDALRIIAACAVVVLHYSDYVKGEPAGRFMFDRTWHFNLFVDLFFVVSGFVIASQYLARVGAPVSVCRFVWRRLARIYPLHLATLAFYIVIALALHFDIAKTDHPARYPFSDLPAQLLLLHALDGARLTFNFPSWSLSAEMFCYVLFPLVAMAVKPNKAVILALIVLPALGNSVYCYLTGTSSWADWINKGGTFRAVPAFNLGIACFLFRDRIARWPSLPGGVAVLLTAFIVFGSRLPEMLDLLVIYAIAVLAIQCDCSGSDTIFTRLHFDRWASLTYSCYMLHVPIATLVLTFGGRYLAPYLPGGQLALLAFAMVILAIASQISLLRFETPMRRYLNDMFDRHFGGPRSTAIASPAEMPR